VEAGRVSAIRNDFTHTQLAPGTNYTYKIRAFNQDESRTSTSCERSLTTRTYNKPDFAELIQATVVDNKAIHLQWNADAAAPISKYQIWRSETGSIFAVIDEIEDLNNFNPAREYTDTTADVAGQSYYYKIFVFDSCGQYLPLNENISRSILLAGQKSSGTNIDLQWNAYEGWDEGVDRYEVFREIDGSPNPTGSLAQLGADEQDFQDDITELTGGEGRFSYTIKAIEKGGNSASSLSNTITIEMETQIFIPNAISLSDDQPNFKPIIDFIDQNFYQLLIFNKWGQQIFESSSLEKGWDGTFEGDRVPGDTYVYLIKFRNSQGETIEKRGTVTVVR
jgi:gliding motility-associated-like protein